MTSEESMRSRTMRAVKSTNTKPELQVRKILFSHGFRYRLHRKDLPGKPDIVFPSRKKVIFVNGCFWHQHSCKRGSRKPKANSQYWEAKLRCNLERDTKNILELANQGWKALIIWECELENPISVHRKMTAFLKT